MFMGRIRTAVAGRRIHLDNDQPAARKSGRDHFVDLTREIVSAAYLHLDFFWLHQSSWVSSFRGAPAIGNIEMLAFCFDREPRFLWKIKCVRHPCEYIGTATHIQP